MLAKSYNVHPKCTLQTLRQRYFDVRYSQVYMNIHSVSANEIVKDIPIGPPLPRYFQIFQIRMTSESAECEWAIHTKPYDECLTTDFIFRCLTSKKDEMLQETWLVTHGDRSEEPFLFLTFKELAGTAPGLSKLEIRVTG